MADERRSLRVERELQQIVARYLIQGLNDPLPGFVTISRVQAGKEIRTAKIFVSVMGSEEEQAEVMRILELRLPDVQKHVNRELRMKFVPRISFVLDKGLQHMLKVESLLHQIEHERRQSGDDEIPRSDED